MYLQQVATIIGADPREIIFTSGATESNNISVKGTARFYKSKKNHVITTQTVSWMIWKMTIVSVDKDIII